MKFEVGDLKCGNKFEHFKESFQWKLKAEVILEIIEDLPAF